MPETAHSNSEDLRKKSDSINIRNGSNSRDDNNVRDIHEEQQQECHLATAKTPAAAGMPETAHVSNSRNDINSEDFGNRSDAINIRNASKSRDANNSGGGQQL
jgi:hypothetical protein